MRAVGVDLGATNARVALVDLENGKILAETKRPWTDRAPETVAAIVGAAEITPRRRSASASARMIVSELAIRIGVCQPQLSSDPNATELFTACTAMHGYSEPLAR